MFSMNGSDPVLDKLDQPKNILHFKYMWYIAPLNVVIQQREIFSQDAKVVEFFCISPGRTGLEEDLQVRFSPAKKIEKKEAINLTSSRSLPLIISYTFN